jgi:hypothetical protein
MRLPDNGFTGVPGQATPNLTKDEIPMSGESEFYEQFMAHSPKSFFHVDWSGSIRPGTFIKRTKLDCRSNPAINLFAAALGLDALTYFGEKHLWGDRLEWGTACRELICEWVRRERHSDELSRFHSVFGFETKAEADRFCEIHRIASPTVWAVLSVDFSGKKDMNWFNKEGTLMEKMYYADCYWRGQEAGANPSWEVLLHPSVYVEKRLS